MKKVEPTALDSTHFNFFK